MKKIIFALMAVMCVGQTAAQQLIQSRDLDEFHSVTISGNINLELIEDDVNRIEIQLFETDIKKFKWSLNNGVINASLKPTVGKKARADIRIYYKDELTNITMSGGKLTTGNDLIGDMLKLVVTGGATVNMTVDLMDMDIEISANSNAGISGDVKYMTMKATEKSKLDTRTVEAVSVAAEAATGAEIYLFASERLIARARNASSIFYAGNPQILRDKSGKTSVGSGVLNIGYKEPERY